MAGRPSSDRPAAGLPAAEVFGAVRWDYDPDQLTLTPLASARRYFADFPWGDPPAEDPPTPPGGPRRVDPAP